MIMTTRKWFGPPPDTKTRKDELENLYVFGYHCKLFRDDEKAEYVEKEEHLIPWMGDSGLMIDRYDGRGSLYDLQQYDSATCNKDASLTPEEEQLERLLDEERYMELHTDLMEKATYEEEEMKRLNEALQCNSYGAVAFNYNQSKPEQLSEEQSIAPEKLAEGPEEEDEPFEPSPDLQLPPQLIVPKTMKHNAFIEKTASFVAKQGNQMEIMLKTKQKDNPMFDFLNFENILNRYYKHMIKLIKTGRYVPKVQPPKKNPFEGDGYLHPSLRNTEVQEVQSSESFLASVRSKLPAGQIANTAYAKLLSNMVKHTSRSNSPAPQRPIVKPEVIEYGPSNNTPPSYEQTATAYPYGTTPAPSLPPVPGVEPVQLPPPKSYEPASGQPPPPGTETAAPLDPEASTAQYEYGTVQASVPPSPDCQPIIDKMASYVARNGLEFEITVRNKNDPRFVFLNDWHAHHSYYTTKKEQFMKELEEERERQQNKSVSFSIKAKEAEASASLGGRRTLLLGGDSSDDEAVQEGNAKSEEAIMLTQTIQLVDYPISKPKPQPAVTAEDAVKNRLALAAREKLATASKDDQVKAERKRKAAMFAAMLKGSNDNQQSANNETTTTATTTAAAVAATAVATTPAVATTTAVAAPAALAAPQGPVLPTSIVTATSSPHNSRSNTPQLRTRPRSPPKVPSRLRRSRSRTPKRKYRSQSRTKSRSRSPRRRKRSRTPPTAYTMLNRISPIRQSSHTISRSPSPYRAKRSKRSRSHSRRSGSKPVYRRSRSRSRSRRSRSRSRHRSHKSKKSHRRSRSKSSKKRSRSRSHKRSKSRSRSKSKKKRAKEKKLKSILKKKKPKSILKSPSSDFQTKQKKEKPVVHNTASSSSETDSDTASSVSLNHKSRSDEPASNGRVQHSIEEADEDDTITIDQDEPQTVTEAT